MTNPPPEPPLIFVVAGEPSGDFLGARLMAALKAETGGHVRFAGVGGEAMAAEGLTSLVDLADLAVMGFFEVLPKAPVILRHLKRVEAAARAARPAALVTIDSWGFTGRLHGRLADVPFPRVHYVAPMVWAWKAKRAATVAQRVDHLLTLLPDEAEAFTRHGLAVTQVGHPVVEGGAGQGDGAAFRQSHGIPLEAPLLCLLPGSRRMEVGRLLDPFRAATERLAASRPGLQVVIPTVATVADSLKQRVAAWPWPVHVVSGAEARHGAFAASFAAIAASGTVALELARAGLPHIVGYKVSPPSAFLYRRLRQTELVNLINILLGRVVVPELLQEACTGPRLAAALEALLADPAALAAQRQGADAVMARLGGAGAPPSRRAARAVLQLINAKETA
ncbi:lipid-A-disaccharide synthase [Roseospirillum parvum]|uniref:Lipid-A-disaccharide synthase n=1 Tax=Roseospirillum parvum TaxID=83401 RepID=A0A1G7Y3H1_9PROT|nr:lipid-A-disaccharide synthase [Roseospirillum parvum]SDG90959.1 lipid-A-disaccharide synthase [Roseospirillum parvum]